MHLPTGSDMPRPARLLALCQAALLALTLVLAPELHRHTCTGVCAMQQRGLSTPLPAPRGAASHSCCHPPEGAGGATGSKGPADRHGRSSGGCTCLDDCCTLYAHGTTPHVVPDAGPAVLLVTDAHGTAPPPAPRAARPRLLPYPNGPPPTA